MHRIAWLPLPLLLAVFTSSPAMDHPRTITVAGEARIEARPDMARIEFGVQERNLSMEAARSKVVRVSRDFLALCDRLGINEAGIRTAGLTIQPEYRWDDKTSQQVFAGYLVQRQLAVTLEDLDRLGELMEGAIDVGVNQVSPPQFESSRIRDLTRQSLADAAADARANALQIARTLDVTLGPLRTLNATGPELPPPMPLRMSAMAAEKDTGGGATYRPGEITVESRVSATFDVVPQ